SERQARMTTRHPRPPFRAQANDGRGRMACHFQASVTPGPLDSCAPDRAVSSHPHWYWSAGVGGLRSGIVQVLTSSRRLFRILIIVVSKVQRPGLPIDGDRAATLQLTIALGRALQAIERSVRPHLTDCGLGLTEFAVLEVLYHKGALPLGEIRDRILV